MPPKAAAKRAAPASESKISKKAKTSEAPALPKSKRWAAVSASRNADDGFRLVVQDVARANSYICLCKPPFIDRYGEDEGSEDDSDADSEDAEDGASENNNADTVKDKVKPKCDGGKTCPCQKPAAEHPDHRWILTFAGFRKWISLDSMAAVRNPDFFGMYTFNDHAAYGTLQIIQNLFLDWAEAETWQQQWAVCEALVLFLLGPDGSSFSTIDDGEQARVVSQLLGRLFLTMLARLESQKIMDETSEVKNLGLILTLYIKVAAELRPMGLLEDDEVETNSRPSRFTWTPDQFDSYINAYASKFGITLYGLADMDGLTADLETDVSLPTAEESWGWAGALKAYQKGHGPSSGWGGGRASSKIGGDSLDITTWSSAERKEASFDGKDPLSAKLLKDIKAGMVMSLA